MLWAMISIFTIMTVANLLATRLDFGILPRSECVNQECHDAAWAECDDYCSLFEDYCFDVYFIYSWCNYEEHKCHHSYRINCVNGHWEYWYCDYFNWNCWK
jgi:hypothetical protein